MISERTKEINIQKGHDESYDGLSEMNVRRSRKKCMTLVYRPSIDVEHVTRQ